METTSEWTHEIHETPESKNVKFWSYAIEELGAAPSTGSFLHREIYPNHKGLKVQDKNPA